MTPETMAIHYNRDLLSITKLEKEGKKSKKRFKESLNQEHHLDEVIKLSGFSYDSNKAINKPIYLLVDRLCASSCESIIADFKSHPFAKIVGQNSAGFVQFGNMGKVILKNSGIEIQMASDFWKYRDGEWREFVGFSPDMRVAKGDDALDFALSDIFRE